MSLAKPEAPGSRRALGGELGAARRLPRHASRGDADHGQLQRIVFSGGAICSQTPVNFENDTKPKESAPRARRRISLSVCVCWGRKGDSEHALGCDSRLGSLSFS